MKSVRSLIGVLPRITLGRLVFVGLVAWIFIIVTCSYTFVQPLPLWASHFPGWLIVVMRTWPVGFGVILLVATACRGVHQLRENPPIGSEEAMKYYVHPRDSRTKQDTV